MPIYVYRCSKCHKEVEELQHFDDPPIKICPVCGTETMHKVISNVGIIFKGSGFYVTDNPHGSSGEVESHHKGEEIASDKSSDNEGSENSKNSEKELSADQTKSSSSSEHAEGGKGAEAPTTSADSKSAGKQGGGAESGKGSSGNKVA